MTAPVTRRALTRAEAAASIGISERTLTRAIDRGEIVVQYLGRKPLIRVSELEAWLASLPTERKS